MREAARLIREAFEAKPELSQAAMAASLGTTQQTVSRWLNGKVVVENKWVPKVCALLSVSQADLMAALVADTQREHEAEQTLQQMVESLERRVTALETRG